MQKLSHKNKGFIELAFLFIIIIIVIFAFAASGGSSENKVKADESFTINSSLTVEEAGRIDGYEYVVVVDKKTNTRIFNYHGASVILPSVPANNIEKATPIKP